MAVKMYNLWYSSDNNGENVNSHYFSEKVVLLRDIFGKKFFFFFFGVTIGQAVSAQKASNNLKSIWQLLSVDTQ